MLLSCRGLVALKTLQKLEDGYGEPLYKAFDYVCGVSTGAVLSSICFLFKRSVSECENYFIDLSKDIFSQSRVKGTISSIFKDGYYSTSTWESILRSVQNTSCTCTVYILFMRKFYCKKTCFDTMCKMHVL